MIINILNAVKMGDIVSTLAFPYPDKEWSQADLLRRKRSNQLVFLTTESGHRYVFDSIFPESISLTKMNDIRRISFFNPLSSPCLSRLSLDFFIKY